MPWCLGCTAFASSICRPLFVYRSPLSKNKLFLILIIQCDKYPYNDKILLAWTFSAIHYLDSRSMSVLSSWLFAWGILLHLKNIPITQILLAFPLTKYSSAQLFSKSYKGLPLKHTNLSWFEILRTPSSYSGLFLYSSIARTTIEAIMSHVTGHQIATSNSLWHSNWSTDGLDPMRFMEEELPPLHWSIHQVFRLWRFIRSPMGISRWGSSRVHVLSSLLPPVIWNWRL